MTFVLDIREIVPQVGWWTVAEDLLDQLIPVKQQLSQREVLKTLLAMCCRADHMRGRDIEYF